MKVRVRIGFCTNDKIGSKLIRWGTNSRHSHVFIEYGGFVFHSTGPKGVHLTTLADVKRYYIVNNIIETDASVHDYVHLVQKHEG